MEFCKLVLWILIILQFSQEYDCQCSFPSSIHGAWVRAVDERVFTINANSFAGFNYRSGGAIYNSFGCHAMSEDTFLLVDRHRNQITSQIQFVYLCLNVQVQGLNSFILTDLAKVSANINRAELLPTTVVPVPGVVSANSGLTIANVCVFQPEHTESKVFYRQNVGATPGAVAVLCPSNIFGNYNYTLDFTKCTGNSSFSVCSDKKTITVDYTLCADTLAYSAGGVMDCMGHVTKGGITLFWTYNRDATVDNSTTYRTTCFAVQGSGTYFIMTYYPNDCHNSQNPAVADYPGGALDMYGLDFCPDPPPTPGDESEIPILIIVIAGAIVGGLIAIVIIVIIIIVCVIRKRKRARLAPTITETVRKPGLENGAAAHAATDPAVVRTLTESAKPPPRQPQRRNNSAARPQANQNRQATRHTGKDNSPSKLPSKKNKLTSADEAKPLKKKSSNLPSPENWKVVSVNQQRTLATDLTNAESKQPLPSSNISGYVANATTTTPDAANGTVTKTSVFYITAAAKSQTAPGSM